MDRKRRNLLKQGAGLLSALPLLKQFPLCHTAAAEEVVPPPYLLHIVCPGGWDPTMVFDNKLASEIIATQSGAAAATGADSIPYVSHSSMDNVASFFSAEGGRTAIINGIACSSISHDQAMKDHLTTPTPGNLLRASHQNTSYSSFYANTLNPGLTAPHLIFGGCIPGGAFDSVSYQLDTTTITELTASIPNASALSEATESAIAKYLGAHYSSELAAFPSTGLDAEKVNNLATGFLREKTLKSKIGDMVSAIGSTSSTTEYYLKMALEMFSGGHALASTVYAGNRHTWDSHTNNAANQAISFNELFAAINSAISYATTKSINANLVILVSSELGRSPHLNDQSGKDHWPYTSAMIWSDLIVGGQVIGGTDDYQRAKKYNLSTGEEDATSGTILSIEHLIATIYYLASAPGADIASSDKILTGLIPT